MLDENGILLRLQKGDESREERVQVCIPAEDRTARTRAAHDGLLGAHFGERRTLDRLRKDAFLARNGARCDGLRFGLPKMPASKVVSQQAERTTASL